MRPAQFRIIEDNPGEPLVIQDMSAAFLCGTITNDAEGVVERLFEAGKLPDGRKLLYYDSDGAIGELVHDGKGHFLGFTMPRPA